MLPTRNRLTRASATRHRHAFDRVPKACSRWTAITHRCSQLSQLAQQYDAWLMSDDAHGSALSAKDAARPSSSSPPAIILLQMGTLSKAIGCYGGYLCASRDVIDLMHNRARTLIYLDRATGRALPPALSWRHSISSSLISGFAAPPLKKARDFTRAANLPFAESPIVPVKIGAADAALKAAQMLENEGFLVVAIRLADGAGWNCTAADHV